MTENKDGFELGTRFEMGGIKWAIIQTAENSVKCIAAEIVERRAFDEENKNDFSVSGVREYLNGDFLKKIIRAGAPEEAFLPFKIDLTADDGLEDYGFDRVRVGLITCDEYRALRKNIPDVDGWWWTATPDSPINSFVRFVYSDGTLIYNNAYYGFGGVRPLCNLKSEILKSFLDGGSEERNAAVKMVRQLSDKWNISEEEIFGRDEK